MSAFPFKAVIFDMDGVIVDTEYYYQHELDMFVDYLGIDVTAQERMATVGASHQDFQVMMADWHKRAGLGDFTPIEAEKKFDEWSSQFTVDYAALLNPGVRETLDELRRHGVRVSLASSSPISNIYQVLDECGIRGCFESITSGDQFEKSKPEPDIYLHAMDLLGLPPEDCCCVEDSVYGITAGKRAGLTVVAKREDRFGFSQAAADTIIDQIPDLLTVGERLKR